MRVCGDKQRHHPKPTLVTTVVAAMPLSRYYCRVHLKSGPLPYLQFSPPVQEKLMLGNAPNNMGTQGWTPRTRLAGFRKQIDGAQEVHSDYSASLSTLSIRHRLPSVGITTPLFNIITWRALPCCRGGANDPTCARYPALPVWTSEKPD